jgi:hypothetical protein
MPCQPAPVTICAGLTGRSRFTETLAGFTLCAGLSVHGEPVCGQPITFTSARPDPIELCTATTDAAGVAACRATQSEIRAFVGSFGACTASYPGSGGDGSASARKPGIF